MSSGTGWLIISLKNVSLTWIFDCQLTAPSGFVHQNVVRSAMRAGGGVFAVSIGVDERDSATKQAFHLLSEGSVFFPAGRIDAELSHELSQRGAQDNLAASRCSPPPSRARPGVSEAGCRRGVC